MCMVLECEWGPRWGSGALERIGVGRQLAEPLSGSSEDRVSHCRRQCRSAGLAHTTRRFETRYDVDFDRGRFVQAHDAHVVEVRLLNAPVLKGGLTVQRARYAEDHRALDLCTNRVRIDDDARV